MIDYHINDLQRVFLMPRMRGNPVKPEVEDRMRKNLEQCLNTIETVWLDNGNYKYLNGMTSVSVADIMACCELEQPTLAG